MNRSYLIFICLIIFKLGTAQVVPKDSMYLGQALPGKDPKVFKLAVSSGYFAAERIAISKDGSEIYYSELNGYEANSSARIKNYKYSNNKWTGPFVLFEGYAAPALSVTEDTLFIEKGFRTYFAVRKNKEWSLPKLMRLKIDSSHYFQVTNKNNYYISSKATKNISLPGYSEWCKLDTKNKDTSAVSLGLPLSSSYGNLDYYIDRDEKFFLTSYPFIGICYPDKKGHWSIPRNFGNKINFAVSGGAYLSHDNKLLFYTAFVNQDNSGTYIYWVKVDHLIDSLKNTNLPPYVKNKPKIQTAIKGEKFTYTIPNDAVCDDDGKLITFEALSLNGSPLPEWLTFDVKTKTFTGIPTQTGNVLLRINAYDEKKEMIAFRFVISVKDK